jgi:hypothetical protein
MTEVFVASKEKSKNAYGQNGYQGASSDLPGKHTVMNRDFGLKEDPSAKPGDWQTRTVDATPYAPAHGMKAPAEPAKVPDAVNHRPTKQAAPGSFQR